MNNFLASEALVGGIPIAEIPKALEDAWTWLKFPKF